jgi:hypothetical protein
MALAAPALGRRQAASREAGHQKLLGPTPWGPTGGEICVTFFTPAPEIKLPADATVGQLKNELCALLKEDAQSRYDYALREEFHLLAGTTVIDDDDARPACLLPPAELTVPALRVVDSHVWPMPFSLVWRGDAKRSPGAGVPYAVQKPHQALSVAAEDKEVSCIPANDTMSP